jgi:hypothetical protein
MRHAHWLWIGLVAAASLGCGESKSTARNVMPELSTLAVEAEANTNLVPPGTALAVTLNTQLSSEHAGVGTRWTGSVRDGIDGIPAGSRVSGTVTAVRPARKGERAMIDLGLSSVTVDGRRYSVKGGTEAVVAGSTRARDLGAIVGGAAAGALVGKAVTGKTSGSVVGGVVGGAIAGKVVSDAKGYQVVLRPGMTLTFRTTEPVRVRA